MKKLLFPIFLSLFFSCMLRAQVPTGGPKLYAIYGVFKRATAEGNKALLAVRCTAPFAKVCVYRLAALETESFNNDDCIREVPNVWGLDVSKNYIGTIGEDGVITFTEVVSSTITEVNSEYVEIQYY